MSDGSYVDFLSWIQSDIVDHTADYLSRGRPHEVLGDGTLLEEWKRAFRAISVQRSSAQSTRQFKDLAVEINLRGLDAPTADASGAILASIRERLEGDPELLARVEERFSADLEQFRQRRNKGQ
jgi:hypothetical protein